MLELWRIISSISFHFIEENLGPENGDSLGTASIRLMILTPNFPIKPTPPQSIAHEADCACFSNLAA